MQWPVPCCGSQARVRGIGCRKSDFRPFAGDVAAIPRHNSAHNANLVGSGLRSRRTARHRARATRFAAPCTETAWPNREEPARPGAGPPSCTAASRCGMPCWRRLETARTALQATAFEPLAARLAGGLLRAIDDESLRAATQAALPGTQLGELDAIKSLPGFVGAAADTLRKAWRAGIDLEARSGEHPRLASLASLEKAVLAELPPAFLRPPDLVAKALQRLEHAATLFGPIEVRGITELSPCWRPLLLAIARKTPVRWLAGPRPVPAWLDGSAVEIRTTERQRPAIQWRKRVDAVSRGPRGHAVGTAAPGIGRGRTGGDRHRCREHGGVRRPFSYVAQRRRPRRAFRPRRQGGILPRGPGGGRGGGHPAAGRQSNPNTSSVGPSGPPARPVPGLSSTHT